MHHELSSTNFLYAVFGHFKPVKFDTFRFQFLVSLYVKVYKSDIMDFSIDFKGSRKEVFLWVRPLRP